MVCSYFGWDILCHNYGLALIFHQWIVELIMANITQLKPFNGSLHAKSNEGLKSIHLLCIKRIFIVNVFYSCKKQSKKNNSWNVYIFSKFPVKFLREAENDQLEGVDISELCTSEVTFGKRKVSPYNNCP